MLKTKPSISFNTRLDPVVARVLDEWCKTRKVTKTEAVNRALRKMLGLPKPDET